MEHTQLLEMWAIRRERIKAMHANGKSVRWIAEKLELTPQRIYAILKPRKPRAAK